MKRTYKRKRKFNRTYAGTLTLRQKDINESRAIVLLVLGFVFMTGYAFMMTSNTFTVEAKVSEPVIEEIVIEEPIVEKVIKEPTVEDVKQEIIKQAQIHGVDINKALAIATCENDTFDQKRKNPHGTATGIFQFINKTWNGYCEGDVKDYKANIKCFMELYPQHPTWWDCNRILNF